MKTIIKTSLTLSVLASANLMGATFYSQKTEMRFPATGPDWNKAADGSSDAGVSSTYGAAANDIVIQNGHTLATDYQGNLTFGANKYTLQTGAHLLSGHGTNSTTFNSDIHLTDSTHIWKIGSNAGTIGGSGSLRLDSHSLALREYASGSTGSLDFGLNIIGDGTLNLSFLSDKIDFIMFSNLSSDFSGTINAQSANASVLKFASGNGALSANLKLGSANRDIQLDLDGNYSLGSLKIDGQSITTGTYSYADLVDIDSGFANNLIDNGGLISVGVAAVPEPSTSALFGLAGLTLLARRR